MTVALELIDTGDRITKPRVGLFVAYYLVSRCSVIINSAIMLAKANYQVDIFHYKAGDTSLMGLPSDLPISLYDLNESKTMHEKILSLTKQTLQRVLPPTWSIALEEMYRNNLLASGSKANVGDFSQEGYYGSIPERVYESVLSIIGEAKHLCFIGYDLGGFAIASILSERVNVPVLYHSLELSLSLQPQTIPAVLKPLKILESKYISRAVAVIVQDQERARLLCEDAMLQNPPLFFVPVSGLGEPIRERGRFFHESFGFDDNQKILLHIGGMGHDYCTDEIISAAPRLPHNWQLVFHGNTEAISTALHLCNSSHRTKIYASNKQVSYDQLPRIVSSGTVGLVFYRGDNLNCFHTGLSSDKMALYMRCGIPAITPDFPSFRRIVENYKCGISVPDPSCIPDALLEIEADYETYRANAFNCYLDNYEFSKHFELVVDFIANL